MYAKEKNKPLNWVRAYKYDMGASAYMIGVCILARIPITFSGVWIYVFLLLAVPFVNSTEHYFCITLLLSTLWVYFPGALISGFSIYTILAILIAARAIMSRKPLRPQKCPLLTLGLLCVTAGASWRLSAYPEKSGLKLVLTLVGIAALIGAAASFDLKRLTDALSRLAFVLVLWYCACAVVAPSLTRNGRLSIDSNVNVNTFGSSCAMLAVILFLAFCFNGRRPWQLIGGAAALALLVLSGSRGALLGFVLACAAALLLDAKRRYSARRVLLVLTAAVAVLLAAALVLPLLGQARFSLSNLIHSVGTSDRINIWTSLLSYIFASGRWILGYGPGTVCTRHAFLEIMDRELYHAHNTFLEAFGELGIVGLGLTVAYVLFSILSVIRRSKADDGAYLLLGMAVYILVHGMVESFYQCFFFWAVLALCGSGCAKGDVCDEDTGGPPKVDQTISNSEEG